MITIVKHLGLIVLGTWMFSTQISASQVRGDMPFICKYEAKRNFDVSQSSSQTLPVEKTRNGYVVYGQSPKYTSRALFYECHFNRRGEYRGIRKTSDKRYPGGVHGSHGKVPKVARRVCKGEAASRWRIRPNDVKITKTKRLTRNDNMVILSGRNYRGQCEVSNSGHIYRFQTQYANGNASHTPKAARKSCKRRAASRWGARPSDVRVTRDSKVGHDRYRVRVALGRYRAECEVNGRGRMYSFSEY